MKNDEFDSSDLEESLTGEGALSASPSSSNVTARAEIAFKIFESSIRRAENLLAVKVDSSGNPLTIQENKLLDVYRAVIVLSISALDAYVKTFLIVEIKQRLSEKNLSPDLKKYIKEELFSKDTLHLVVLENNFFDKVVEKFEEDFEKKSFQGQKAIERYMKLAGFDQIFRQIADSADKALITYWLVWRVTPSEGILLYTVGIMILTKPTLRKTGFLNRMRLNASSWYN